jgi:hypothetical protein
MWNLLRVTLQLVIFTEKPPDFNVGILQYFISGACFVCGLLILVYGVYSNEYHYSHLLFSLICSVVYLPSLQFSLLVKLLAAFCFFKLFGFYSK